MAKNLRRFWCIFGFVVACAATIWAEPSQSRLEWLRAEIARHDDLYFKQNAPEITDSEYDVLKRELLALEKAAGGNAAQRAPSPGDDRTGAFPMRAHRAPMLSLEKVHSEAELRAFVRATERALRREELTWVVEPKLDGLAISLVYENRKLVAAATRGNGREGDDVLANVLKLLEVPRELPSGSPDFVEVRGEIFMELAEFARINAERAEAGEEPFAHPRNLAAGTMKMTDARDMEGRRLSALFFGIGGWEGEAAEPLTEAELLARLQAWRLPVVDATKAINADAVWTAVDEIRNARPRLGFPIDGVVIKVNERAAQRELGTGGNAPRWAAAFKFAPDQASTRLRSITLQVGRTGVVTPVAELDPVRVGGGTLTRATLHNADEIARRDLREGDWVFVEKAGDVIPSITGVDLDRRDPNAVAYSFPDTCRECDTRFARDGAYVRCPNVKCPAQVRKRVEYFASRTGVGIGGLGPALIAKLQAAGKLTSVADVYRLRREDGVPERVLGAIERSRSANLERMITALGFAGVGRKGAHIMAEKYGSLAAVADAEELGEADRAMVRELLEAGVNPEAR